MARFILRRQLRPCAACGRVDDLVRLTERCCVIYNTLRSSPKMQVRMNIVEGT